MSSAYLVYLWYTAPVLQPAMRGAPGIARLLGSLLSPRHSLGSTPCDLEDPAQAAAFGAGWQDEPASMPQPNGPEPPVDKEGARSWIPPAPVPGLPPTGGTRGDAHADVTADHGRSVHDDGMPPDWSWWLPRSWRVHAKSPAAAAAWIVDAAAAQRALGRSQLSDAKHARLLVNEHGVPSLMVS